MPKKECRSICRIPRYSIISGAGLIDLDIKRFPMKILRQDMLNLQDPGAG